MKFEDTELGQCVIKRNKLQMVLDEIEAVACGEKQIQADGVYDDTDGLKWIYDRIQAFKEAT